MIFLLLENYYILYLKLNRKFQEEKERHLREVDNLRKEINSFTNQLAEKNSQIKLMQEQSNCLEKLLNEKEDQLAKTNQELMVIFIYKTNTTSLLK